MLSDSMSMIDMPKIIFCIKSENVFIVTISHACGWDLCKEEDAVVLFSKFGGLSTTYMAACLRIR